jgi:SAM-dependent methyltransferase
MSHAVVVDGERFPVVAGIPYLRSGREELRARVLDLLDAGDHTNALLALLADQDDWWTEPAPPPGQLLQAVTAPTLRSAMEHLGFGRVGDYFAFRWSDPTFLSGLALLDAHAGGAATAFELGCGAGHLLRELRRRGVRVAGADVVFAKLWLAKRFVVPDAQLVCLDAGTPGWSRHVPGGRADLALCHDALHYLPDIPAAVAELRAVADVVLVGHAHNGAVDNLSAGSPLDVDGYAALLDGAVLYDDEELGRDLAAGRPPHPHAGEELRGASAIALALGGRPAGGAYAVPPPGTRLRVNPLLVDGEVRWPSDRYRDEYAALSPHLTEPYAVPAGALVAGRGDEAVDRLARRRVLLDLPERW